MKVIDLLNKIANGEDVPEKITIRNDTLFYNKDHLLYLQDYYLKEEDNDATWEIWAYALDDEVEIIEEEPRDIEVCGSLFTRSEYNRLAGIKEDKKIPTLKNLNLTEIDIDKAGQVYGVTKKEMIADIQTLQKWINKIIDKMNKE